MKDREAHFPLVYDEVEIMYRRSSARPIEYAIMLRVNGPGGWRTVFSADNSHREQHVDEHHCHRYIDGERQPAEPLPFPVAGTHDAMAKILDWFRDDWRGLI